MFSITLPVVGGTLIFSPEGQAYEFDHEHVRWVASPHYDLPWAGDDSKKRLEALATATVMLAAWFESSNPEDVTWTDLQNNIRNLGQAAAHALGVDE